MDKEFDFDFPRIPPWLVVIIFLFTPAAWAQDKVLPLHVLENESLTAYLYDKPCPAVVLQMIKPEHRPKYKGLDGSYQDFTGCWRPASKEETGDEDRFFMVFSDGEGISIPQAALKRAKGQVGI